MYFEDQCQWTKYFVYLKSFVFINSPDKNMRKGKREILEWKFRKSVPKFTQESTGL